MRRPRELRKPTDVTLEELRSMPLHSAITCEGLEIFRVPNGWLYVLYDSEPVFVPEEVPNEQ